MERLCGNCEWWDRVGEAERKLGRPPQGRCRRYPASIVGGVVVMQSAIPTRFGGGAAEARVVSEAVWFTPTEREPGCGEFKPAESRQPVPAETTVDGISEEQPGGFPILKAGVA